MQVLKPSGAESAVFSEADCSGNLGEQTLEKDLDWVHFNWQRLQNTGNIFSNFDCKSSHSGFCYM